MKALFVMIWTWIAANIRWFFNHDRREGHRYYVRSYRNPTVKFELGNDRDFAIYTGTYIFNWCGGSTGALLLIDRKYNQELLPFGTRKGYREYQMPAMKEYFKWYNNKMIERIKSDLPGEIFEYRHPGVSVSFPGFLIYFFLIYKKNIYFFYVSP